MRTSMQDDSWVFDFEASGKSFLNLPNALMESVCRFLPTQADRYRACLIHPAWQTAAMGVLWEAPELRNPQAFKLFCYALRIYRRSALSVRHLTLCLPDEVSNTAFRPIVNADLRRHQLRNNIMANPQVIMALARQCERLTRLTIYGWRLEASHLDQLTRFLPDLTALKIIGGPSFIIARGQPTSLRQLSLDGEFRLGPHFATSLAAHFSNLRVLQLSLLGLPASILQDLCRGQLQLSELTLTHASCVQDKDANGLLACLPDLSHFCLEGTTHLTGNTITNALAHCHNLQGLEIRAQEVQEMAHQLQDSDDDSAWNLPLALPLRSLLLENLPIDDKLLANLAPRCTSLVTLGFTKLPHLSDVSVARFCAASALHLQTFHALHCVQLGSNTVHSLASVKSLCDVYLEDCNNIQASDIHALCRSGSVGNLQRLRLVGYPTLAASVTGSNETVINLDRTAISSWAPRAPKERYLTGKQIMLLAKQLTMSTHDLESLIESIQDDSMPKISDNTITLTSETHVGLVPIQSASILQRTNEIDTPKKQISPAIAAAHLTKQQTRPTTPAVWASSNDLIDDMGFSETYKPISPPMSRATLEQRSTLPQRYSRPVNPATPDPAQRSARTITPMPSETASQRPSRHITNAISTPPSPSQEAIECRSPNGTPKQTTADLGGWGATVELPWSKPSSSTPKSAAPSTPKSSTSTGTPQASAPLYTMDNYEQEWQQIALEVPAVTDARRRPGKDRFIEKDNEGWGRVKAHVPWDDLRTQGFAYDLLQEQRNTPFWTLENGVWKRTDINEKSAESFSVEESWPDAGVSQPPGTDYPHTNKPKPKSSPPRTYKRYNAGPDLSSDESVDWDDDDGVTIKTEQHKGNGKPTAKVLQEPPEHPGFPKWCKQKEWITIRESTAIDHPTPEPLTSRFGLVNSEGWGDEAVTSKPASQHQPTLQSPRPSPPTTVTQKQARPNKGSPGTDWLDDWVKFANDASATTKESQSNRVLQSESLATEDLLVDTSDVVTGKPNRSQSTAGAQSYDLIWETMSSLSPKQGANTPVELQKEDTTATNEHERLADTTSEEEKEGGDRESEQMDGTPGSTDAMTSESYLWDDTDETKSGYGAADQCQDAPEIATHEVDNLINSVVESLTPTTKNIEELDNMEAKSTIGPVTESSESLEPSDPTEPKLAEKADLDSPVTLQDTVQTEDTTSNPGKRLVTLTIETSKYGVQKLQLYENRDPREDVQAYCKQFEMQEHEDAIYDSAISNYTAKKTERLLSKKKKKRAAMNSTGSVLARR